MVYFEMEHSLSVAKTSQHYKPKGWYCTVYKNISFFWGGGGGGRGMIEFFLPPGALKTNMGIERNHNSETISL
jgi:hypothetical protein